MNLVWATRGRSWGFRFLLDGDTGPAPVYERPSQAPRRVDFVRRVNAHVAPRFLIPGADANGRSAHPQTGRTPLLADDGRPSRMSAFVWLLLSDTFARVWNCRATAMDIQGPGGGRS